MVLNIIQTAIVLIFVFTFSGHASQESTVEDREAKRKTISIVASQSAKRQKIEIEHLIAKLKKMRSEAERGERPWLEVLQEEKQAIAKKLVTEVDLGIQSHSSFLPFEEVLELPIEEQYEAVLKVRPDDRQFIPNKIRQKILAYQKEQLAKLTENEKADKIHAMKAQLGLLTYEFTNSQDQALCEELPAIDSQIKLVRFMTAKNKSSSVKLQLEYDQLSQGESKSDANISRMAVISKELANLEQKNDQLEQARWSLAIKQTPHIQKVMREYQN